MALSDCLLVILGRSALARRTEDLRTSYRFNLNQVLGSAVRTEDDDRGAAAHQRLVFTLWTWTCSPLPISAMALPMSCPYFQIVSPALMSRSAALWPIGISCLAVSRKSELSIVTMPSMSVPALRPSTTTTPTVSFLS